MSWSRIAILQGGDKSKKCSYNHCSCRLLRTLLWWITEVEEQKHWTNSENQRWHRTKRRKENKNKTKKENKDFLWLKTRSRKLSNAFWIVKCERRPLVERLSHRAMANLNFEQPPRSIASNSSLSVRGGSGGVLSSSTLAGHVTPTSGMFSGSSASTASTANSSVVGPNIYSAGTGASQPAATVHPPQQLSPMGSRGLFGQRAFTERRAMPALGSVFDTFFGTQFVGLVH